MRHEIDNFRISVQYHAQDIYVRLRHSAATDPFVFYSRLLIATLLLALLLSVSISAIRARGDTAQKVTVDTDSGTIANDDYQQSTGGGTGAEQSKVYSGELHRVVSVTDGDTIKVDIDGVIEAIRIIGLNAPETNHPSKPAECFGSQATTQMKNLIGSDLVSLEPDSSQDDRDRYGRLLRHVHTSDGVNVAHEMIKHGYAHEYTYNLAYKYQSLFEQAEQYAKTSSSGLWAPGVCSNPTTEPPSGSQPVPLGTAPAPSPSSNVYYQNCTAARQAGAAPVYIGEPGYGVHLDRDRDGIGCE